MKATRWVTLAGGAAALAVAATASAAVIVGTNRDDRIRGTGDADQTRAPAGNDHVWGRDGNDAIAPLGKRCDRRRRGERRSAGRQGQRRHQRRAGERQARGRVGQRPPGRRRRNDRAAGRARQRRRGRRRGQRLALRRLGPDRSYGGPGDDRLHALAPDGQVDLLDCGVGHDTAIVRRSELRTRLAGCEQVEVVEAGAADDEAAENADTDDAAE